MAYFNYNGKLYSEGETIIGPGNRGLRYGDGLFETMLLKDGKIIFSIEHFERLWKGLKLLQFDIPKLLTPGKLIQQIIELAEKNKAVELGRIRLAMVRSDGGLYDAISSTPNYIIECWPLKESTIGWNSNGLVLAFYEEAKKHADYLANIKHNNYLLYAMAAMHAQKLRCNDAIVLNHCNDIADTTIANLFMIKNETIYTPALEDGCVEGITRKMLISYLLKEGYVVEEKSISKEALLNADEVFLTNSAYTIRWVQQVADTTFTNKLTQIIYKGFMQTI